MVDVGTARCAFAHPTLASLAPQDDGNDMPAGRLPRYGLRFSECYYRLE
jgi:hypothetical protein